MADEVLSQEELLELLQPYAIKAAEDFEMQSFNVISAFYGDYEPTIYERAFALYGMWKTEIQPIENGWEMTITYSSAMIGGPHHAPDKVFDGPFVQGYHGGPLTWGRPKKGVPQMSPSPWELMLEFFDSYEG